MRPDKIAIERDFLEHLLNALANQKFIHSINADALSPDTDFEVTQLEMQRAIDDAWVKGMDLVKFAPPLSPKPTEECGYKDCSSHRGNLCTPTKEKMCDICHKNPPEVFVPFWTGICSPECLSIYLKSKE